MEDFSVFLCQFGMDKLVCRGAVHTMISTIMNELPEFLTSPRYFCGRVTGACSNPYKVLDPKLFIDRVVKDKPDEIKENNFIDNLYEEITSDPHPRETIRVLHFSDIHLDFEYTAGANTNCNQPTCC